MGKNHIKDTFLVLIQDETLKRLLWYPPEDILKNIPNPLSLDLPNISDNQDVNWEVINDRILMKSKTDDLAENEKCRIYLYLGGRNNTSNVLVVKQDIIIDVLWHELYENDIRINSISERLAALLQNKPITGIGKMVYYDGFPVNAPQNYQGYRFIYQVGSTKL